MEACHGVVLSPFLRCRQKCRQNGNALNLYPGLKPGAIDIQPLWGCKFVAMEKLSFEINIFLLSFLPIPITHYPLPNTQYPIPNTQYPLPITQHPTPNTQHPIPNTQHPTHYSHERPPTSSGHQMGAYAHLGHFCHLDLLCRV